MAESSRSLAVYTCCQDPVRYSRGDCDAELATQRFSGSTGSRGMRRPHAAPTALAKPLHVVVLGAEEDHGAERSGGHVAESVRSFPEPSCAMAKTRSGTAEVTAMPSLPLNGPVHEAQEAEGSGGQTRPRLR